MTLSENVHSWNREVNVIYVANPVGTGFQVASKAGCKGGVSEQCTDGCVGGDGGNYSAKFLASMKLTKDCAWQGPAYTNEGAGENLYQAVVSFFDTFTKFQGHKLILGSESYGGYYTAYTASAIIDHQLKGDGQTFIFDGFMVGNPATASTLNLATTFLGLASFNLVPTGAMSPLTSAVFVCLHALETRHILLPFRPRIAME